MLWALPIVQGHNSKMGMWVPMRSQHAGTPQRQGAAWKHMGFRSQHAAALTAAEPSAGIQKVWRKGPKSPLQIENTEFCLLIHLEHQHLPPQHSAILQPSWLA